MASTTVQKNMSNSLKSETDCNICAETRPCDKMIKCPFCDFESCVSCVETFLMGILDTEPRCMNNICKKIWSGEFLASSTSHNFHNNKYRKRRAQLLLEREKSMLPGTQELVQQEKLRLEIDEKIADIKNENAMYRLLIRKNKEEIDRLLHKTNFPEKSRKKVFTRSCPVKECRGFLSTSFKCGTCLTYSCKSCHLPKSSKEDEEHKCDPDLVKTVELIESDTKQCPGCATPIYKISGCDQMYCVTCHTPFSWTSGKIETGVIHNPHYYQMQRALNGGVAPRNRGDVRCGGPPNFWSVSDQFKRAKIKFHDLEEAHRMINHINIVVIPHFPNHMGDMDNSSLRVQYLMNVFDEKTWVSRLKAKLKKQEKCGEINQVLRMYTQTLSDIFGNIVEGDVSDVEKHFFSCIRLREYTNDSLKKIGIRFNNVVPAIGKDWSYYSNARRIPEELR